MYLKELEHHNTAIIYPNYNKNYRDAKRIAQSIFTVTETLRFLFLSPSYASVAQI